MAACALRNEEAGRGHRPRLSSVCEKRLTGTLRIQHIEHLKGRTETWSVSPSVDMLLFDLTIPATVPQGSEIPEGLINNHVRKDFRKKTDDENNLTWGLLSLF